MRATCEAGEVPSTAKYGGTNDAVAAGQSHVSSSGWVHTMTELTSEWPDEITVSSADHPLFLYRERRYTYLNGPPVPHERIAYRSRHFLVKTR